MFDEVSNKLVKDFYISINTSSIQANVQSIPPNIDRDQYLSMKECKKCSKTFSKHDTKKYYCHFCYIAFCNDCCVLTTTHPETLKEERICNTCYLEYTKLNVLEVSENFVQVKLEQEISERKDEEKKKEKIIADIDQLHKTMEKDEENFRAEVENIEKDIREEQNKVKAKELSTLQMRNKLNAKGSTPGHVGATVSTSRSCIECQVF